MVYGLGLEDLEFVLEGGVEGGEVGIEVGPGEVEGGERGGVRLEVFECFAEILFFPSTSFRAAEIVLIVAIVAEQTRKLGF